MARSFEVIDHTWIPMADGVRLSARLWLPDRSGQVRLPVVLELIPYRKGDAYRDADSAWGSVLATAGIAFARVDVRGTGDSEGILIDEYSEVELADAEACISWLAAQDWCNGNVGMRGISWGGINTLAVAARQPPALKAIVPIAAAANRYTDDAHYLGGRLGKPNLDWGVLFKTVLAGPPDPAVVGDTWVEMWQARLDATPAVVTEWLRHQTFDDYWQRASVLLDPAAIRVPIYLVAGWQDTYVNFIHQLWPELGVPAQALIGPWGHTYPNFARPQGMDWASEEIGFWQRWLVDEADEDESSAILTFIAEQTARQSHPAPVPGSWRRLPAFPSQSTQFRLMSNGLRRADPESKPLPLSKPIHWQESEPVGFNCAEWLDRLPEEQTRDDERSLCFDSEPLTGPLVLLGRASVSLQLQTLEGSVLSVRLCDVDAQGRSWLVSYATQDLQTTHAQADSEGALVELQLRLAAHTFKAGHRLRISISGGLWPMTWPAVVATGVVLSDGSLTLPLLEDDAEAECEEKIRSAQPPLPLPEVERLGSGRYRYVIEQPGYEYQVADVGTRLSGAGHFVAELGPQGDSRWRASARRGWQRPDWDCAVEAEISLERTAEGILVEESLQAYRDGQLIFERTHAELLEDGDSVAAD